MRSSGASATAVGLDALRPFFLPVGTASFLPVATSLDALPALLLFFCFFCAPTAMRVNNKMHCHVLESFRVKMHGS